MRPRPSIIRRLAALVVCAGAGSDRAMAQPEPGIDSLRITRAQGVITIDGDLSDPAWRAAPRVDNPVR